MGITGLLPYLEAATRPCHVSEFRGGSVAVDSYCFLHKGANAAAEQLARGEDNQIYVHYCIKYVKMLLSYNIHPIMVFDGRNLPAKAETEAKRRENRKKAKQRGAELLRLGKIEEARNFLKQCIDITPKMAHNLIEACRDLNVDCIVAPYESDAQLTFFDMKGVVDAVITEDSDLILFGCKKVLFKLDLTGAGRLVESEKIYLCMKMRPDQYTFEKFRLMCILSGCDYVSSLSGIGLKKAEKFLKLTAETNPEIFLNKLPRYLNMKHLVITDEYKQKFMTANATLLHQTVFDPFKKSLVSLNHIHKTGTNPEYLINCGDKFDNETAFQIAIGNMNPYSDEKYSDWTPSKVSPNSIWSEVFKKRISVKAEKEIRKQQFKGFFKNEKPAVEVKSEELEEQKVIEDLRIEEELSTYINNKLEVKEDIKEEPSQEIKAQEEPEIQAVKLSPVLNKNPFLKKKLSKFPRTHTDSSIVVKSRFFSNDVQETKATSFEQSNSENDTRTIVLENVPKKLEYNKVETTDLTLSKEESKKRSFAQVVVDSPVESLKEELDTKPTVNSQQVKKRKVLGPCKTIGLSKKKTIEVGQKTLHTFFSKITKKEG